MPQVDGRRSEYATVATSVEDDDPTYGPHTSVRSVHQRVLKRAPASLPARGLRTTSSLNSIFNMGVNGASATRGSNVDEQEDQEQEFVCYGDRVCFLCEGQLLALTRKFNLTYNQMAVLVLLTLCSGGTFGIAGLLIWKKGLLRKRYAALFSDAIYADDAAIPASGNTSGDAMGLGTIYGADGRPIATNTSSYFNESGTKMNGGIEDSEFMHESRRSSIAETVHGSTASGNTTAILGGNEKVDPRKPVTFRIFEYDPTTQTIKFESVGKPVEFGAPVVVVHAATQRAIKYKPHRGAVTLSKPLKSLHFQKDVMANLPSLQKSSMYKAMVVKKRARPQSITSLLTSRLRSLTFGGGNHNNQQLRHTEVPPRSMPVSSTNAHQMRHTEVAPRSIPHSLDAHRPQNRIRARPRSEQAPIPTSTTASTTAEGNNRRYRSMTADQTPPASNDSNSSNTHQSERFYRSMSEACMTFANDIQDTINDTIHRQRDQRDEKKRVKQLMKDLPNMSFANHMGKYFIATVQPVKHHLSTSGSQYNLRHAAAASLGSSTQQRESFLRWGAPMSIIADYNGKACGIRPRQYYKDCQLYLTTETSQTTIIPLREDGDLQSMAKESTRLLAHIEKRQVQLSVGTYNVWMMPRIVSAFTSVSPKKNTRARLIADVLPPCDVWVFTECFDHRARAILLDKLKAAGYFYLSPTVGHKRLKRENMRKVLNGGVVLASKYPIVTVRIKLFKEACLGADKLADKGVLYCKILKDGLPVHIFSTHLQAWSDPLSRAMRRTQMVMIAEFMRSMGIDEVNDPVLFVGDLNVNYWLNKTDQEYDEMLEIFNASDPSIVITQRNPSLSHHFQQKQKLDLKLGRQFSFDPRLNALAADGLSTDGSLELLDFVLYSKAHRQPSEAKSWIVPLTTSTPWNWRKQPQYNLSDHFPVVSSFTFDM